MLDQVRYPADRFSHNEAKIVTREAAKNKGADQPVR